MGYVKVSKSSSYFSRYQVKYRRCVALLWARWQGHIGFDGLWASFAAVELDCL